MPRKLVVYVSGPYRSKRGISGVWDNIMRARDLTMKIWATGAVPLCPHLNTMFMDGTDTDDMFLDGDLELVARCDAMIMVRGWEDSSGSIIERGIAIGRGMPVFESVDEVRSWLEQRAE